MIKYKLKCDNGHSFDSWFNNAAAYDKLESSGMLSCAVCGSQNVSRAIMAPQVCHSQSEQKQDLTAPTSEMEKDFASIRKKIEENSENVGENFASEARAMHEGETPERSIIGEAKLDEAKKLVEDGIPILPLPWGRKGRN